MLTKHFRDFGNRQHLEGYNPLDIGHQLVPTIVLRTLCAAGRRSLQGIILPERICSWANTALPLVT